MYNIVGLNVFHLYTIIILTIKTQNSMKKLPLYLMMMVLSLSLIPSTISAAEKNPTAITANTKEVPAEIKVMYNRLEEIKAMDKSSMTSVEKKELRKEVRTIKATLRSSNSGIYLSVGAIIIIILLLILLL
jgi:phosphoglycerol transferase MdoB-like AlkP superfamily enzyme